jgi:hypothetical protein
VQKHQDVAKVAGVAAEVAALDRQLRAADKQAAQINTREGLLGRPVTDYSQLRELSDLFDPFQQFWSTAAGWQVRCRRRRAVLVVCWLTDRLLMPCPAVCHRRAQANHKAWLSAPLVQLDGEAVDKQVAADYKVLHKAAKVSWWCCARARTPRCGDVQASGMRATHVARPPVRCLARARWARWRPTPRLSSSRSRSSSRWCRWCRCVGGWLGLRARHAH